MPFSQNNHMVQAVAPQGSDPPSQHRPAAEGWPGRRGLLKCSGFDLLEKLTPVDLVPISEQVAGGI